MVHEIVPVAVRSSASIRVCGRAIDLLRRLTQQRIIDDRVPVILSVRCPTMAIAAERGTSSRSKLRTADRLMSCWSLPGNPAARHARLPRMSPLY
jgi:hypothetical protein